MKTRGGGILAVLWMTGLCTAGGGCAQTVEPEPETETAENSVGDAVSFLTNQEAYKVATGIASLVGGWPQQAAGIIGNILNLAGVIGTFGGESGMSSAISAQLSAIQQLTEETLSAVLVGDDLSRERESRAIVEEGITWVQAVRDDLATGREIAGELSTPTFNDLNQSTRFAVDTLAGGEYWQRAFAASVVAGDWTLGTEVRPQPSNGRIFEHRSILPFYMHAVAARVTALGIMDPDFAASGFFSGELQGYANFLEGKLATIEGGIACGFVGYYKKGCDNQGRLKAICADIYTNETAETVKDGQISFSLGCFDEDTVIPPDTTSDFLAWPEFDDQFASGLDDARQKLRQQLALFEVRHMIDDLERMAANAPDLIRPDTLQLMSWGFADLGRALQLDGSAVVLGDSNDAGQAANQMWSYDAFTGRIWHAGEYLAGRGFKCLDAQGDGGTRLGNVVVGLRGCLVDAQGRIPPQQRWTFNYQTGILLNGKGRVLDVMSGDPSVGNGVWLWDENFSPAQMWGW